MGRRLGKKANTDADMQAYRFCGKPQGEDLQLEMKIFGCCRYLWNRMLGDRNTLYNEIGIVPDNTPADYKDLDECLWLKEADSLALANVQLALAGAFASFFAGGARYPRFKSKKHGKKSYTTNALYAKRKDGTEGCNIRLDEKNGLLYLPKHKNPVVLNLHRKVRQGGRLKSVTVTREPDGKFYYSLLYEYPPVEIHHVPDINKAIGLDMSLPKLYVDDRGNSPDFSKPYRTAEKRLSVEQRKLSRMKKGSKNYEKQLARIAELHAKTKHQRNDLLHKCSCVLTDDYDIIGIEDVDMSVIRRCLDFGKSVSDIGWGRFVSMLEYKAKRKGKVIVRVDKWYPSSKTCGNCGYVNHELELSDRTYVCPECGYTEDRDVNAAKNIKKEGLRIYAAGIAPAA